MLLDYEKVRVFWNWFKSVEAEFRNGIYQPEIIEQIDKFVQSVNDRLDWEIGPIENIHSSEVDEQYFCISPCLNEDLLKVAQELIQEAPVMKGWKFYSTKPRKGWILQWEMTNEVGQRVLIDASNWRYMLYRYNDNTFYIEVIVDNVDGNKVIKRMAIDICIVNLLGEKRFMDLIKNVIIVDSFDNGNKGSDMKNLEKHLDKLFQ